MPSLSQFLPCFVQLRGKWPFKKNVILENQRIWDLFGNNSPPNFEMGQRDGDLFPGHRNFNCTFSYSRQEPGIGINMILCFERVTRVDFRSAVGWKINLCVNRRDTMAKI